MNLLWRTILLVKFGMLLALLVVKNRNIDSGTVRASAQYSKPALEGDSNDLPKQNTQKHSVPSPQFLDSLLPLDPSQTQGFEKISFAEVKAEALRATRVVYRPLGAPGKKSNAPENIEIQLDQFNVYLMKNRKSCPVEECVDADADEMSPLLVFTDKSKKILATVQSWWPARMSGMFSLHRFNGAQGSETLLWSVHTGGADLSFDHFLFELQPRGKIRLNTDFVSTITGPLLDIRGRSEVFQSDSEMLGLSSMRGFFLSVPAELDSGGTYSDLLEDSKFKNAHYMSAIPVWQKMARKGEEELVLLQIDPPRITFSPLWAERFVYRAIEWNQNAWKDASSRPSAQAFYRAAERDVFSDLSKQDGKVRNWMLGTWASYKALLGEWADAQEVIRVKADHKAYREQVCEVSELMSRNPEGGVGAAKLLAFINYRANKRVHFDPKCSPPSLVEFLESEFEDLGIFPNRIVKQ